MNLTSYHLVAASEAVLRSSLTLSRADSLKLVARKLTSVSPPPPQTTGRSSTEGREIEVSLTSLPLPYLLILGAQIPPLPPFSPDHELPGVSAGERSSRQEREGCSGNGQGRQQRDPARVLRTEVGVLEADRGSWVYTACPGEVRA